VPKGYDLSWYTTRYRGFNGGAAFYLNQISILIQADLIAKSRFCMVVWLVDSSLLVSGRKSGLEEVTSCFWWEPGLRQQSSCPNSRLVKSPPWAATSYFAHSTFSPPFTPVSEVSHSNRFSPLQNIYFQYLVLLRESLLYLDSVSLSPRSRTPSRRAPQG